MLASCLALTNSLSWTSITRSRLLTLSVTLNIHEAALLAIALFLWLQRKLRRDGRILLLLQLDTAALMGYTGAVFERFFGSAVGIAIAGSALVLWTLIPVGLGLRRFRTKDF